MKKIMMAIAILVAMTASAQRHQTKKLGKDLSAEEVATLRTKKMTLALALNKKQSDKIYTLVLNQVNDRKTQVGNRKPKSEERTKLTKEQKFERANAHLDKRIAMQNEMKAILTDSQFEQYRTMQAKRKKGNKQGKKREHRARK